VLRRVRLFAEKTYEKPESGEAVIVEIDEMWQYLGSKKTNFGSGRLLVAVPVDSLHSGILILPEVRFPITYLCVLCILLRYSVIWRKY
jgi:hypothetical protein